MIELDMNTAQMDGFFRDLKQIGKRLPHVPERAVRRISVLLTRRVKQKISELNLKKTGTYRRNIFPFQVQVRLNDWDGGVYTHIEYAPVLEEGSPPHEIRPKNKKALAFISKGGETVVVKKVNHPGTKAYRVFASVLEEQYPTILGILQEEMDLALGGGA